MRVSQSSTASPAKGRNLRNASSSSSSSPSQRCSSERLRTRTKQKRLDAICEKVYNSNRVVEVESNGGNAGGESVADDSNAGLLRRSSRVRRAPAVLDASPSPAKRRRKIDLKSEESIDRKNGGDRLERPFLVSNSEDLEEPGSWRSRLRSRVKNAGFDSKEKDDSASPRIKRKLFEDSGREIDDKKEGFEGAKSKRISSAKGLIDSKRGHQEIGSSNSKEDGNESNVGERLLQLNEEEDVKLLKSAMGGGSEIVVADDIFAEVIGKGESNTTPGLQLNEERNGSSDLEMMEQSDKQLGQADCENEVLGLPMNQLDDGGCRVDDASCLGKLECKPLEDDNVIKDDKNATRLDKLKHLSTDTLDRPHIREGRRCGLCGGGTDGKPPKRLVRDSADSDNETYGGSSASEEPNYDIWDGFGDEPSWLGRLLGPINDRFGIAGVWVHQHCAVWSPEVYFAGLGCLKNVRAALCRGKALKCSRCGRPGATIGCRVDRCPKTYHLPCGRADGCIFDHRKFLIACIDHRHLFQPQGSHYLHRMKKLKAKKLKLEMRKHSHDAWRKDFEAEEKWLENCGEDEEFLKREGKRLHRDILRIAPVYIGGSFSEHEKLYQGWESVAGLQDVIQCLKEVVILPLLYPEFFSNLGLTPPRGVLLHGYPGTGKTLVVRALIGSCSRGDKRIAYFARKGADCLGKYVGDAERQLRLLFQVAEKSQPSIIFFDEIDGLAPRRTRQQDQTHSSVVSTLLALLDGLKSRGSVIVIGATNRPEAIDPALRRPGRFDREIYFPLPSVNDRAAILSLHTQRWPKPVSGSLLKWIARQTAGFAGADLQALCTQAAMIALKRNCALQELLSAAEKKANNGRRVPLPSFAVEERDWLDALAFAPPPCSRREAGMAANDVVSSPLHTHLIPCLLQPLSHLLVSLYLDERIRLPPSLSKAAKLIKSVIISALEKKKMSSEFWWSHLCVLIQEADVAWEIETNLSSSGLLIGASTFADSDALNDDTDDDTEKFLLRKGNSADPCTRLLQNVSYSFGRKSGFRVLIAGSPKSGQRHLASCLLHGFVGHVEIQKVNLATISQEGRGDVVQGMTHILLKCASAGSCIIYMPRIDLWAMETHHQVSEEESDSCAETDKSDETAGAHDAAKYASQAWNLFVEQVDSMYLSASLMILATSEVPSQLLPHRISQFFMSDVLNSNASAPSEHTIPRFFVQVDGKFNRDMVINSSAAELSQDLIQQFVQLIHHRTHIGNTCREHKICDTIDGNTEIESHSIENGAPNERTNSPVISERIASEGDDFYNGNHIQQHINGDEQCPTKTTGHQEDEVRLRHPQDSVPRILSNNRVVKGKSSLLLAISTFGFQILRYPHFAELCWATSKLKEGPCTDVNGPWKGWPFNSCIIRPNSSSEKIAVGCSSINLSNKEHSGVVRGLIAVGILAYNCVYTTVREVSLEVRKVLELLVGRINAKILGGKDRYRFLRLLSQVAYLEDMVNSWAYTLQSLELDSQMPSSHPRPTVVGFPCNCHTCDGNPIGSDACKPNVLLKSSHEVKVGEQSSQRIATENSECIDSNKGITDIGLPNSEARVAISEEVPSQQLASLAHSAPGILIQSSSPVEDPLGSENTLNEQYKMRHSETCMSENHVSNPVLHGGFGSSKQSNGLALAESVLISKDGASSQGDIMNSSSRKVNDQYKGLSIAETGLPSENGVHNPDKPVGDLNFTLNKRSSVSSVSGVTCLYGCCSECLHTVRALIQKILIHEWESNESCTIEDVHDVVASWSVNLLSAVKKFYVAESDSNSDFVHEKLRPENYGKFFECQHASGIQLDETSRVSRSSGNRVVVPMECSSHSESNRCTAKTNACTNSRIGLGLKFFFRDSVLVPSNPDKDVLPHCKFENLCLCSLIEWILMIKQPLD